jgi:hypothetical protein
MVSFTHNIYLIHYYFFDHKYAPVTIISKKDVSNFATFVIAVAGSATLNGPVGGSATINSRLAASHGQAASVHVAGSSAVAATVVFPPLCMFSSF